MSGITLLGALAGVLTTAAFVPQTIRSWRTRQTKDISLGMFSIMCVGIALWIVYGALLGDLPIILANSVTLALAASILILKIRYG